MGYLDPGAGVLREVRTIAGAPVAGTDEVQTITIGGTPTGGTFTLTLDGETTGAISWSATNATLISNIDTALEALSKVGASGVAVAEGSLTAGIGTITVTFNGALLAKKAVALMTVTSSLTGSSPTIAVAETTPGVNASFRGAPKGTTITDRTNGKQYINTGTDIVPTWSDVEAQAGLTIPAAAEADQAALTATALAAAVPSAPGALTATAIAAAIPSAAPAGGTGATEGAYDTAVNRDAMIATVNGLRTWALEVDADYEAMLVDITAIRTALVSLLTWATEVDLDYEAGLVDWAAARTKLNATLAKLRTAGVIAAA